MRLYQKVFDPACLYKMRKPMTYRGRVYRAGELFLWKDLDCTEDKVRKIFKAGYIVPAGPEDKPETVDPADPEGNKDPVDPADPPPPPPEVFSINTASYNDLKKKAQELKLDTKGNKNDLRNRIFDSMEK